jgi:N-acetyl-beta-hexosaminidase
LPVVEIKDWPALAYRGVMVDMSHGALPTEKEVKRQLDFLARWKLRRMPRFDWIGRSPREAIPLR